MTADPVPLPDCPIPAEQLEPDLATVIFDRAAQTVTMPRNTFNRYELEHAADVARAAALIRCYSAIGGTVKSLPSVTPAVSP